MEPEVTKQVSELIGAELDAAVAKIEGVHGLVEKGGRMCHRQDWDPEGRPWRDSLQDWVMWIDYAPSQCWDHGGPIIERERIELHCISRNGAFLGEWSARITLTPLFFGATPLIAAMRAFVASKKGVPDGV